MGEEELQDIQDPSTNGVGGLRFRSIDPMAERMWNANEVHDSLNNAENGLVHTKIKDIMAEDSYFNAIMGDYSMPGNDVSYIAGNEFGESVYDKDVTSVSQLNDLESFRANQQSAGLKLLNGIGKMGVTTITTALDSTIGLIWGIGEFAKRAFDDEKSWVEAFAGLYDNDFSRAMEEIEHNAEKWMPNYRTRDERESAWYENLGTANFWADVIIKNAGFTFGTMLGAGTMGFLTGGFGSGAVMGKIFKFVGSSLNEARNYNLGAKVGASLFSALNEGRIEGRKISTEAMNNYSSYIDGDYQRQLQTLELERKRLYDEGLEESSYIEYEYNKKKAIIDKEREERINEAKENSLRAGNMDMFLNIPILWTSNMIGTLSHYRTGFANAERNVNVRWNPFTQEYTRGSVAGHALKETLIEGNEEMMQAVASKFAENFYSKKYDEYGRQVSMSASESFTSAFRDTYLNADAYQEFFAGALTGLTGVIFPHKVIDEKGEEKWKFIQGGIFDSDTRKEIENNRKIAQYLNENRKANIANAGMLHMVEMASIQNLMDMAAKEGNKFEFKNLEIEGLTKDIMYWKSAGKLNDYKALIGDPDKEVTDNELDNIIKLTTASENGKPLANSLGLVDKDGNIRAVDKNERADLKKKIQNNRKLAYSLINDINESMEWIDKETGHRLSNEQLQTLAWMKVFPKNLNDRIKEMTEEIGDVIGNERYNAIISGLTDKLNDDKYSENEKAEIRNRIEFFEKLVDKNTEGISKYDLKTLHKELGKAVDDGLIDQETANKIIELGNDISASFVYQNAFVKKLNEYLMPDNNKKLSDEIAMYNKSIDRKDSISIASKIKSELSGDINDYKNAKNKNEKSAAIAKIRQNIAKQTNKLLGLGIDKRNSVTGILLKDSDIGKFLEDQMKLDETFLSLKNIIKNSNDSESVKARKLAALEILKNTIGDTDSLFKSNSIDDAQDIIMSANRNDENDQIGQLINLVSNPDSQDAVDFFNNNEKFLIDRLASDPNNFNVEVGEDGTANVTYNENAIESNRDYISKQMLINELRNIRDIVNEIRKRNKSNKSFNVDKINIAQYKKMLSNTQSRLVEEYSSEKNESHNTTGENINLNNARKESRTNESLKKDGKSIFQNILPNLKSILSVTDDTSILDDLTKKRIIDIRVLDAFFNIDYIIKYLDSISDELNNFKSSKNVYSILVNSCKDEALKAYIKSLSNNGKRVAGERKLIEPVLLSLLRSIRSLKNKVEEFEGVDILRENGSVIMQDDLDEKTSALLNFIGKIYTEKVKGGEVGTSAVEFKSTVVDVIDKLVDSGLYKYFEESSENIRNKYHAGTMINETSAISQGANTDVLKNAIGEKVSSDNVTDGTTDDSQANSTDENNGQQNNEQQNQEEQVQSNTADNNDKSKDLHPAIAEYETKNSLGQKFIKLTDYYGKGDANRSDDPRETADFLSGKRRRFNKDTGQYEEYQTLNSFEFINNGRLSEYINNGGRIYVMTSADINGEGYNSNKGKLYEGKNLLWKTIDGEDTFYMYEDERVVNGVFTHGDKLMKDTNGNNIPRKEYNGDILWNGSPRPMKDILKNLPNVFYSRSKFINLYYAVKLDNGELLPIGSIGKVGEQKDGRKTWFKSRSIQSIADFVLDNGNIMGELSSYLVNVTSKKKKKNGDIEYMHNPPSTLKSQLAKYESEQYRFYTTNKIEGVTIKPIKKKGYINGNFVECNAIVVIENGVVRTFRNLSGKDNVNEIPYIFFRYNNEDIRNKEDKKRIAHKEEIRSFCEDVFDKLLYSDMNGNTLYHQDDSENRGFDISDFYEFSGVLNGLFRNDAETPIALNSDSLTDGEGKNLIAKLDDGSARIGIVIKRKEDGALMIHDSSGNQRPYESIKDGKLYAGATVLLLKRSDGSFYPIRLNAPKYNKNNNDSYTNDSFTNASTELTRLVTENVKDKTSQDNILFEAFNRLNESIYIPINRTINNGSTSAKGKSYEYHISYYPDTKKVTISRTQNGVNETKDILLTDNIDDNTEKLKSVIESFGCTVRVTQSDIQNKESAKSLVNRGFLTSNLSKLSEVNGSFTLRKRKGVNEAELFGKKQRNLKDVLVVYESAVQSTPTNTFNIGNIQLSVLNTNEGIVVMNGDDIMSDEDCIRFVSERLINPNKVPANRIPNAKVIISNLSKIINGNPNVKFSGDYVFVAGGTYSSEIFYNTKDRKLYVGTFKEIEAYTNTPVASSVAVDEQPQTSNNDGKVNSQEEQRTSDDGNVVNIITQEGKQRPKRKSNKRNGEKKRQIDNSIEYHKMNVEKELEWLERAMPWLSLGDRVKILKHLENVIKDGSGAWGVFKDGCIYLSENAQRGTLYHEAYHAVFNLCLTDNEREELYSELKEDSRYKDMTNEELEEVMAEGFREYVELNEDANLSFGERVMNWFRELFSKIFNFKTYPHKMNCLFNRINSGYYSKSYNNISEIYNSDYRISEIGTKQQYIDYLKTVNNGDIEIFYTTNTNGSDKSLFINIGENSNINTMFDNRYRQIAEKLGYNASITKNGIKYNTYIKPCLLSSKKGLNTINDGNVSDIKYVESSEKPYYLGSKEDIEGFKKYVNSSKLSRSKERNKWINGINREEEKYLSERGISRNEFNNMSPIVKDKIMECIG